MVQNLTFSTEIKWDISPKIHPFLQGTCIFKGKSTSI